MQTTWYVWDIVVDGVVVKTFMGVGSQESARIYRGDYGPTATVKRRAELHPLLRPSKRRGKDGGS